MQFSTIKRGSIFSLKKDHVWVYQAHGGGVGGGAVGQFGPLGEALKKTVFFYYRSKGGGGPGQSKKSLSENTQIFSTAGALIGLSIKIGSSPVPSNL